MSDEFKKIMEFFSMDPEEKASNLNDVFDDSIAFFEKFKYIIEKGTPEQKKEMIEHAATLQNKLQSETSRICEATGLTAEELEAFIAKNFMQFMNELFIEMGWITREDMEEQKKNLTTNLQE